MKGKVLLVPGIGNSGPDHWQSHWEARSVRCERVLQRDWDHPICAEWTESLESAVRSAEPDSVIVAHSLGCLLVVQWLAQTSLQIGGAMLVAVPDPDGPKFPKEAIGFAPVPMQRIACSSIVVASVDDPYSSVQFARGCAEAWGSELINIGSAGHINASSGLGEWIQGRSILESLY